MLHPNILDGAIARDMGTFHGVNKGPTMSGHMVCDDLLDQEVDIQEKNEDVGWLEMINAIVWVKNAKLEDLIDWIFDDIKSRAIGIPMLQLHSLSTSKVLKGKQ
jgi:hypothetical protein